MLLHTINPLSDVRWPELLRLHPAASVFHTPGWLSALHRTYGYEPIVVTTCPPSADLTNGIAFCHIHSLLTGSRLVSLPFSDHCEPLVSDEIELQSLLSEVGQLKANLGCRYVELRPLWASPRKTTGFGASTEFFKHELRLTSDAQQVFRRFSKDSVQRKIRRAERERLTCEQGRSEALLREFYRLLLITRRRHQLPPQPLAWFRELVRCLGESVNVRVAFKGSEPIASIITLRFKNTMVYKYGCSNAVYHCLGGMQMLFWTAIQEAIDCGLSEFDFGRTDLDDEGLAIFKDRWCATRSTLKYWTAPPMTHKKIGQQALARTALQHFPGWLLAFSGRVLYKHIG